MQSNRIHKKIKEFLQFRRVLEEIGKTLEQIRVGEKILKF